MSEAVAVRVGGSSSKGDARRGAMLEALERLLRDRPLSAVGVSDITEAAGVVRSAFYFYFPSKEAAVAELLGEVADELLTVAAPFLDVAHGRDLEAVGRTMRRTVAAWAEHRHLVLATIDARGGNAEVRQLWDGWIDRFVGPVAASIAAERDAGNAPSGPDPVLLARLLLSMNERALERHARGEDDPSFTDEQLADALTTTWLSAIFGGPTA